MLICIKRIKKCLSCLLVFLIAIVATFIGIGSSILYDQIYRKVDYPISYFDKAVKDLDNEKNDKSPKSSDLLYSLQHVAQDHCFAQRNMALNKWIKNRSVADCKILLESDSAELIDKKRLIAARWIQLNADDVMKIYPNGEYLDLLAVHDKQAAIKWFEHFLAGRNDEQHKALIRNIKYRYYLGLASRDPIFVRDEYAKNEDLSGSDAILCYVAERGVPYALDWLQGASPELYERSKEDCLFLLAKHYPDQLFAEILSLDGKIIYGDRFCSIAVIAGLVCNDSKRSVELMKSSDNLSVEFVKQVCFLLFRHLEYDNVYEFAKLLPNESKYDDVRYIIALELSNNIGLKGFEYILTLKEPYRTRAFNIAYKDWLNESDENAKIWLIKNRKKIPPHLRKWDKINFEKDFHE